jgi:LPS-assembly lipoprotein
MSWAEPVSRRAVVAAALILSLGGCFQPLYGPALLDGGGTSKLKAVEIGEIKGRFGHFLRTELQFALGGGALPEAPSYLLSVTGAPQTRVAVVNSVGTTAQSVSIFVVARYRLTRHSDGLPVLEGSVSGSASYERNDQRFASLSAGNDAEERVAKLVAGQIQTRLAMAFASGTIQP